MNPKTMRIHRYKCTLKGHKFILEILNETAKLTAYLSCNGCDTVRGLCMKHRTVKLFWYQVSTGGESVSRW